jgi:HemY protein
MKKWLWFFVLLILAAVFTWWVKTTPGEVVIVLPNQKRMESGFGLFVLFALMTFVVSWLLLLIIIEMVRIPKKITLWQQRKSNRIHANQLREAMVCALDEEWPKAEKLAHTLPQSFEWFDCANILAAYAAMRQHEKSKVAYYLELVPSSRLMKVAKAKFYWWMGDHAAALRETYTIEENPPLRIRLLAAKSAGDWDEVIKTANKLKNQRLLSNEDYQALLLEAYTGKLSTFDANDLESFWKTIPASIKTDPDLASEAAKAFIQAGQTKMGERILVDAIEKNWCKNDKALRVYGELAFDLPQQIARAEKWLAKHPQEKNLLLTLGKLCIAASLWGKAKTYLTASDAVSQTEEAKVLLAKIPSHIGESS